MAGFNDANIVRVYVSLTPAGVQENQIPSGTPAVINFQAEAGEAIFGGGGSYRMLVVVRDLTDGSTVVNFNQPGSFGDSNWPTPVVSHPFTLNGQPATKKNHIYQAIGVLLAGNVKPDVSFIESELFIIV
jgi:hypothetical protein